MKRKSLFLATMCSILFSPTINSAANDFSLRKNPLFDGSFFGCDAEDVRIIESFTTPHHTQIAVLQHKNGAKFVVKQETRNNLIRHLAEVRDALGSYVAQSINAPANAVVVIPAHYEFIGKQRVDLPATLHAFVPGLMSKTIPEKKHIRIQQPIKPTLPEKQWGLSRMAITCMVEHPDLCVIAALDTFIANKDRHRGNFFYDDASDRFYAVDLESSFRYDLAAYACNLITSLIENKNDKLSKKEVRALTIYQKTLIKLVSLHTPESLFDMLVSLTTEAGIQHEITRATVSSTIAKYRSAMIANYASCQKLIQLLNTLLERYSR